MDKDKRDFYELTAKRFAAATINYGVSSVVHVEDKDDIWFWQQVLTTLGKGKYKFLRATTNEKGNLNTGCTQCLKYKGFLSKKFFICIDSDLRYLMDENISAHDCILQTYTYSWENHCAFSEKLQRIFNGYHINNKNFNFVDFLKNYSETLFEPFLFMLYNERNKKADFNKEKFRKAISLQYMYGDENNNGEQFIKRIALNVKEFIDRLNNTPGFDLHKEILFYSLKGINKHNVYLYVRGHCLYNSLISIGKKLCEGTGVDFEQNILKSALDFDKYQAISQIRDDINILNSLK